MKITGNPTKVGVLIVILVIVWFLMIANAKAQEVGTSISFGAVSIGSDFCDFANMRIGQDVGDVWEASLIVHGNGSCRGVELKANGGFCVVRAAHKGPWTLGFGGCVWEHGDIGFGDTMGGKDPFVVYDTDPQISFTIYGRRASKRTPLFAEILHASTGGSTATNPGKNFWNVGWRL